MTFLERNQSIEDGASNPFCLFLSHRPGHPPYQAAPDIRGMYAGENLKDLLPNHIDLWWYGKANRNVFEREMTGPYYDQYRKYCETLTAIKSLNS